MHSNCRPHESAGMIGTIRAGIALPMSRIPVMSTGKRGQSQKRTDNFKLVGRLLLTKAAVGVDHEQEP